MIIKICGLTKSEDLKRAQESGADTLGAIFGVPASPRNNDLDNLQRLKQDVDGAQFAVLLRNAGLEDLDLINTEVRPNIVHLCGTEYESQWGHILSAHPERLIWQTIGVPVDDPSDEIWKRRLDDCWDRDELDRIVLDGSRSGLAGGTGATFPHQSVADHLGGDSKRIVIAGGLKPDNIVDILTIANWGGLDVSSGVESEAAVKDHDLIEAFIKNARQSSNP
jgi:phosphoribosylanthranilate isomerase